MKWAVVALLALVLAGCEDPHANEKCVDTQTFPKTYYIQSGNMLIPITSYEEVCVKWVPK
jgi:hypothetical protein